MAKDTPIEWCDSAVNPVMGCDGCELWIPGKVEHCYAGSLHKIRGGNPGYADEFLIPKTFAGRMATAARWSDMRGKPHPGKPWLDGQPRIVFVSDMGDALSRDVPFPFLRDEVIANVRSSAGRRHVWMWLTKQPHRMAEFSRWLADDADARFVAGAGPTWPANLWAGTSLTEAKYKPRVRHLRDVPAAVRFLSVEPIVADVGTLDLDGIALCLIGGESGPGARPCDMEWGRSVIAQCRAAKVAPFFKQAGSQPYDLSGDHLCPDGSIPVGCFLGLRDRKGGDLSELPEDLRVREFPTWPAQGVVE